MFSWKRSWWVALQTLVVFVGYSRLGIPNVEAGCILEN
jgi:hypothetical protein